jgi:hypothetical protein
LFAQLFHWFFLLCFFSQFFSSFCSEVALLFDRSVFTEV